MAGQLRNEESVPCGIETLFTIVEHVKIRKNFKRTKAQIKPKPTNKIKLSKQKTTEVTIFCAEKLLRGVKLFVLRFGPFFLIFLRSKGFYKKNKQA